jgi:ADP-heptose:LPS heptosyltransferase
VRGPNWLGDAVMCEPALRGLRRLFPDAQIALLVKPAVADLFAGHSALTRVLTYDTKGRHAGLSGKWVLAGQLRKQGFDLAVLFQNAFEESTVVSSSRSAGSTLARPSSPLLLGFVKAAGPHGRSLRTGTRRFS